jgi:hypothetical protein
MLSLIGAAVLAVSADRAAALDRASAEFELALIRNDVPALERVLSPDWQIIDSNGHVIDRDRFIAALESGELSHNAMRASEERTRILGETAIQIARADGSGTYRGQPFTFSERATDLWVWVDGHWLCALTQLTKIPPAPAN